MMLKKHIQRRKGLSGLGLRLLFGAGAALVLYAGWQQRPWIDAAELESPLTDGRSSAYYARMFDAALAKDAPEMALAAARKETETAPRDYRAWQRLALGTTLTTGRPDRDSLRALMTSYELAPYPGPADMAWRVDFAGAYWPYMPDVIQKLTLTQIAALGDISKSWDRRRVWCKTLPDGALAEAACATVPGTWRKGVRQGPPPEDAPQDKS